MRKGCLWLGAVAALFLLVVYVAGSWFFAGVLLDSPVQSMAESRERMEFTSFAEAGYPEPEEVSITGAGPALAAWFFDNQSTASCGVVILHGYTGNRYGATQYMPGFWARGCDLLLYDARGHGESDDALHTYGFFEKEDADAAIDWLAQRAGLTDDEIGVAGVSYGAATALQLLPQRPGLAFVLADSPYQDLYSIADHQAGEQFGSWARLFVPGAAVAAGIRSGMNAWAVSPMQAVAEAETPVLLIHAREDDFTPVGHSEAIYAVGNPATTELQVTDWGAGHGRSILVDPDAFWAIVDEFLARLAPDFGTGG